MAAHQNRTRRKSPSRPQGDAELNLELLHSMLLQRRFEERCAEAYALGKIGWFCHLYIGQEAVSTGTLSMLRPTTTSSPPIAIHGQALARGMTPRSVMAELFGRQDGCARGKGGSMHMFDVNTNFLGGHGIVGGHVPLAAGVGFAIKYRGGDQVIVCFMGESVVKHGAFHEALNMAALWKLPCVFIIENNRYGMGTALERASAIHDIYERGARTTCRASSATGRTSSPCAGRRRGRRARAQGADPDAARDAHLPLHGPLHVRRGERHLPHQGELEEYMKRDPITLLARTCRKPAAHRRAAPEARRGDQGDRAGRVGLRRASPELPLEALYEDVLRRHHDLNADCGRQ
jgi:pyruvate dehydrogenase E1 component alpha subunit